MSDINHWDPHNGAWWRKRRRTKGRRISFLDGLEPGVVYLTIRDLEKKAGVKAKVIRYALAKGYLKAARRQPGRAGVLIHPDEATRWTEERKKETKH